MHISRDSVFMVADLFSLQFIESEAAMIKDFSIIFFPPRILPCFPSFSFSKIELTCCRPRGRKESDTTERLN